MTLAKRSVAYWRLHHAIPEIFLQHWPAANRYLACHGARRLRQGYPIEEPSSGRWHRDQRTKVDLMRRAVGLWHRFRNRPEELLRPCPALLATKPAAPPPREFATPLQNGR